MTDQLHTRIVGAVLGRTEAVAFVTDESGLVRVRWRGKGSSTGVRGYVCDHCGHCTGRQPCRHARAAHYALTEHRENEREEATP